MCRSHSHYTDLLIWGKCDKCGNKWALGKKEKKTVDLENMQVDGLNAEEGYKVCAGLNYERAVKQLQKAGFSNIPLGFDSEGNSTNPF